MLKAVHISNFRSLAEDVTIEFPDGDTRCLVLTGLNGSGKSNVLDALRFVGDAFRYGYEPSIRRRGGLDAIARHGTDHWSIELEVEIEGSRWWWGIGVQPGRRPHFVEFIEWCLATDEHDVIDWNERVQDRYAELRRTRTATRFDAIDSLLDQERGTRPPRKAFHSETMVPLIPSVPVLGTYASKSGDDLTYRAPYDFLGRFAFYTLFPPTLRRAEAPSHSRPMDSDGTNWASVLKDILAAPERLDLLAGLRAVVPDINDLRVVSAAGYDLVEFLHRREGATDIVPRGAAFESDGTLRVTALLVALLQRPAVSLLGIEEPELAIHTAALRVLWDFIEEASATTQIVLTTHSTDLLDLVPPSALRVVEMTDAGTQVAPVEQPQLNVLRARLTKPGELHRSQGLASGPRHG